MRQLGTGEVFEPKKDIYQGNGKKMTKLGVL